MMPKIKQLSPEDTALLQACAVLDRLCLPEEAWSFESFLSETRKPGGIVLAAVHENQEVCGFLTAFQVMDTADLTNIAVAPAFRRQGIAGALLKKLCSVVGNAEIFLEVRESNQPAIAFYQKYGFVPVGIRKHFYQNPDENAVLMQIQSGGLLC